MTWIVSIDLWAKLLPGNLRNLLIGVVRTRLVLARISQDKGFNLEISKKTVDDKDKNKKGKEY